MNPRFMRLRPELTVDEAIRYLRKQGVDASLPIHYGYVLDPAQRLLGVVPTHTLFSSPEEQTIRDLMKTHPVSVTDDTDQELSQPGANWSGATGRVVPLVVSTIDTVANLEVYLCGNGSMIREVRDIIRLTGVCPIYTEQYYSGN